MENIARSVAIYYCCISLGAPCEESAEKIALRLKFGVGVDSTRSARFQTSS